jgi:hypothetical protein
VPQSLRNTWIAVILATLAVVGTGFFIVRNFVRDVFVDCRGSLQQVEGSELGSNPDLQRVDRDDKSRVVATDLDIKFDEKQGKGLGDPTTYKNVRVVWSRSDATCACSDVTLKWNESSGAPYSATIWRDKSTGLFVVQRPGYTPYGSYKPEPLAVFRKSEAAGHRFQMDRVFSGKYVSMLVFLLALGALGFAATRALRATPYATRMHAWRTATLRPEGFIESDTGATLGTLESRTRVPAGPVIVDPSAVEGRDIYREMPILGRRHVAAGSHQRWVDGTMRRLRDARSIAILSTITTGLALVAHVIGS